MVPASIRSSRLFQFCFAFVGLVLGLSARAEGPYIFSHLAGSSGQTNITDGTGSAARFNYPYGIVMDSNGSIFVSDAFNHTIRKITAGGVVTTFAGKAGQFGSTDATGAAARFYNPFGLAIDSNDNIFVADYGNFTVRKITPAGVVTTLAGTAGVEGSADGTGAAASFSGVTDVAVDSNDNVFVTNSSTNIIRKITASGVVTTIAGLANTPGDVDATGSAARFTHPYGIAVGPNGNLYVTESSGVIRKITADAVVTTIAGSPTPSGQTAPVGVDGTGSAARFTGPIGIDVDADGNLFVCDAYGSTIRKITPAGVVTTIGGAASVPGSIDGNGNVARFTFPTGIIVDASGHLYIADALDETIRYAIPPLPAITTQPQDQIIIIGGGVTFTVAATGTAPLSYQWLKDGVEIAGATSATYSINAVTVADAAAYAAVVTNGDGVAVSHGAVLSVVPASFTGYYTGSISGGGHWAMHVAADLSGTFIGYLPGVPSAVVVDFTVGATGAFSADSTEKVPSGASGRDFKLSGSVLGDSTVTGQLVGLGGATFTGSIKTGSNSSAGLYTADGIGVNAGTFYVIVGSDGSVTMAIATPAAADGATGTLNGSGSFTGTTAAGGQVNLTVGSDGKISGSFTANGSTTPVYFGGLPEGTPSTTRLVNISTRAYCTTGSGVTIAGFVIAPGGPKKVLIRGVGPTLATYGIPANQVLADPTIELHKGTSIVATNDNLADNGDPAGVTTVSSQVGAVPLASTDTTSSATVLTLDPGVYSVVVRGKNEAAGIVLVEVYDADSGTPASKFVNISSRAYADTTTSSGSAIAGFVVPGNAPKTLLLRAVGPTLTKYGVSSSIVLADPTIELHDAVNGNVVIATNDNAGENGDSAAIAAAAARVGAVPLESSDTTSAAMLVTLQPGRYSFVARGKNNTAGVLLIEAYDAD